MFSFEEFPIEKPFDFRKRLEEVHKRGLKNEMRPAKPGEVLITERWNILLPQEPSAFLRRTAEDLQDYFAVSMGMKLQIAVGDAAGHPAIILASGDRGLDVPRSFIFHAVEDQIRISGCDDRGCAMGCYYLEDLLSLRENACLDPVKNLRKEPLFSPRLIHSGYGKVMYPESYMRKAAHYGFDGIILYTNMENDIDFARTIETAAANGLDVYFYSKFTNPCHPSMPEAKEYYRSTYGAFFRKYPQAKGIMFVGESMNFPSRDPNVVQKPGKVNQFNPARWPCEDYPELIRVVKEVIDEVVPERNIIFWTYNFGHAPEDARQKLIKDLPPGITLNVNFALHDVVKVGRTVECPLDYSLGIAGPSKIFRGEAAAASTCPIKLISMGNTAGKTWDFGTVPYIPAPYQWARRYQAMLECREQYGLSGLLESHSYGWQPSVVSELAKWMFWSNGPALDDILKQIAIRDAGTEGAEHLLAAWKAWSDGMENYPMPIEDQYGPCRVGPAYPFYFTPDILTTYYKKMQKYPDIDQQIVFPWYRPVETAGKTEGAIWRIPAEIEYFATRISCWEQGVLAFENAIRAGQKEKRHALVRELAVGNYICNTLKTARNVKRWWLINSRLTVEPDPVKANGMLDEMLTILEEEAVNTRQTIPLLRCNSALGFECAMGYPGDEAHIDWKLSTLIQAEKIDIPSYRELLREKMAMP